jgi:PAT family beta-lactamase induction signal transducer AmpG
VGPGGAGAEQRGASTPHLWVTTTYFAEGFPYSIVNNLAEILVASFGASLQAIGLTGLLHLPWNLKFLWGPFVDQYETKRAFLIGTEVATAVLLVVLALSMSAAAALPFALACMVAIAFVAATQDIAIDGYYLEALDERGQSKFVGYRAAAYRLATVFVSGPLVIAVGLWGWQAVWMIAAASMAALLVYHATWLPRAELRREPISDLVRRLWGRRPLVFAAIVVAAIAIERAFGPFAAAWSAMRAGIDSVPGLAKLTAEDWVGLLLLLVMLALLSALRPALRWLERSPSAYAAAFVEFLAQPKVGRILAFILLFRTGESFLMKMRFAFLNRQIGVDVDAYGLIQGTVGFAATAVATLLGGWLIARHGLRRWIWPFVLSQNLLNLLYVWLAAADPAAVDPLTVAAVVTAENFGAGLGTAVFMVYLMRCVDPRHKAAHMAILTALMSLGFTVAGVASGYLASAMGYTLYFAFTFVATIPAMVLLPFVPYIDGRAAPDRTARA